MSSSIPPSPPHIPSADGEPDLLYVQPENFPADIRGYPTQLDLALEIVSEGTAARNRDYVDKRADYAKAGITEYWIVDPQEQLVTVFTLQGDQYQVSQACHPGDTANSLLLPGLAIVTSDIWALAEQN